MWLVLVIHDKHRTEYFNGIRRHIRNHLYPGVIEHRVMGLYIICVTEVYFWRWIIYVPDICWLFAPP